MLTLILERKKLDKLKDRSNTNNQITLDLRVFVILRWIW
jgi:hypothetical protein